LNPSPSAKREEVATDFFSFLGKPRVFIGKKLLEIARNFGQKLEVNDIADGIGRVP